MLNIVILKRLASYFKAWSRGAGISRGLRNVLNFCFWALIHLKAKNGAGQRKFTANVPEPRTIFSTRIY